jgi:hypothetical protein
MQKDEKKQLKLSDIGYHGKPVDSLSKRELQIAFLEVAQHLYNCAVNKNLTFEGKNQSKGGKS